MGKFFNRHKLFVVVFLLCFCYWGYLFATSQMEVKFDAKSYEKLGKMLYEEGWEGFFQDGVTREPLYPVLISTSMRLSEQFGVQDYRSIQKIIQISFLFASQFLLILIMTKIQIDQRIQAGIVLYYGFSPAVVNAAFSLYSEIGTFPFVLAIIYLALCSWQAIQSQKVVRVVLYSFLMAGAFLLASFVKGIFQYVFIIFLVPFLWVLVRSWLNDKKDIAIKALVFVLVATSTVAATVTYYRFFNHKYHGDFDFTNRYDFLLFGNASKRVAKLDRDLWAAHFLSVPGSGVCRKFFDKATCQYCEFYYADLYRSKLLPKEIKDWGEGNHHDKILRLTVKKIFSNPIQYTFLTFLESFKMAFWESSQAGFVAYPSSLTKLFRSGIFRYGIRFGTSMLTYVALFYVLCQTVRRRAEIMGNDLRVQVGFFVLLIIVPFTGLYALYSILTRFSFPIASLYMVCIAYFLDEVLIKRA